jgi:hypothetical protein
MTRDEHRCRQEARGRALMVHISIYDCPLLQDRIIRMSDRLEAIVLAISDSHVGASVGSSIGLARFTCAK